MLFRRSIAALAALVLSSTVALAQGASFAAGTIWGNDTAAARPGKVSTITAVLDRALGSTRGSIIRRGAAGWAIVTPGTTGLPWVSNGAGVDPAYQVLGIAGGGTNCSAASGTCLDNISGFSSTGFIQRTGPGAYSFFTSTGSGTVVALQTSPSLITPSLGVATGASLALNGATLGANALAVSGTSAFGGVTTVTSANASAFAVGANGAANPAFQVSAAVASAATGVFVNASAAGSGVSFTAISSGTNEDFGIHAKGSGRVFINTGGTGGVTLAAGGGGVTIASALTYGGVALSNAVTGTGNMVLSASPTFTGTISASALNASGTVNLSGLTVSTALALDGSKNVVSVANTGTGSNVLATSPTLVTPALGAATATSINGVTIDNNAWTTYTPTVTCVGGAPASSTASGRYKQLGKTIFLQINISAFSAGTCTNSIKATLPVASSANAYSLSTVDFNTASMLTGAIFSTDTTVIRVFSVVGAFPPAGALPLITGVYEAN